MQPEMKSVANHDRLYINDNTYVVVEYNAVKLVTEVDGFTSNVIEMSENDVRRMMSYINHMMIRELDI